MAQGSFGGCSVLLEAILGHLGGLGSLLGPSLKALESLGGPREASGRPGSLGRVVVVHARLWDERGA